MLNELTIKVDNLRDGQVIGLLEQHRLEMFKHSPPENVHALDVEAMNAPDLVFWSARMNNLIVGCAALKQLDQGHAEVKSMKVSEAFVGKGVGRALLNQLILEASQRGCSRLSLETGPMEAFVPARRLYESVGFENCPPFNGYAFSEHSVCMTLKL